MEPKNSRKEKKVLCSFVMVESKLDLPLSKEPPLSLLVELDGIIKCIPIEQRVMERLVQGCNGDGLRERNLLRLMETMPKQVTVIVSDCGDEKIFGIKEEDIDNWLHKL